MNDLVDRVWGNINQQRGTVNSSVNWNSGPEPVAAYLQQFSPENIYVMNVRADWAGFKFQASVGDLVSSDNWGIQTNFYSSFKFYYEESGPLVFLSPIAPTYIPTVDTNGVWFGVNATVGPVPFGVARGVRNRQLYRSGAYGRYGSRRGMGQS